jgi:hypothetical protein
MAKANSILVNDNKTTKDTRAINEFINPHIYANKFIKHRKLLQQNATLVDIDPRFDYRPDRLAYEQYGQDFWYPAILAVNNLGSMLQFKAESMNFKCLVPDGDVILGILAETNVQSNTGLNNVHEQFKN